MGGWPSVFYVSGILAIVWCVLWLTVVRSSPDVHPWISEKELKYIQSNVVQATQKKKMINIPWIQIITSKAVIAYIITKFTINWGWIMMGSRLPIYLQSVLNMTIEKVKPTIS